MSGDLAAAPAPHPCDSCPYRRDAPPQLWEASEYVKLIAYDAPTGEQPPGLFLCHQAHARPADTPRVCAGWLACHGPAELLGVRLAAMRGVLSAATVEAVLSYTTTTPVHPSGTAAALHGARKPTARTRAALAKLTRRLP